MQIVIEVVALHGRAVYDGPRAVFDASGGSIGRHDDCTLVLVDDGREVSRHHAYVYWLDGAFWIANLGLNPIRLAGVALETGAGAALPLAPGLWLDIGPYRLAIRAIAPATLDAAGPSIGSAAPGDELAGTAPFPPTGISIENAYRESGPMAAPAPAMPDDPTADALRNPEESRSRYETVQSAARAIPIGRTMFGGRPSHSPFHRFRDTGEVDTPGRNEVSRGSWWQRALGHLRKPALDSKPQPVDCSVFSPLGVVIGSQCLVQVSVHPPGEAAEAARLAQDADPGTQRRARRRLELDLPLDMMIDLHLQADGFTLDKPQKSLRWTCRPETLSFALTARPEMATGPRLCQLQVQASGVPVGDLQFVIEVVASRDEVGTVPPRRPIAKRYRKAFVSYASADRAQVLSCVQLLPKVGVEFFQDVLNLEPGERWAASLYRHIDESDVFLLFWSSAAKQSEWVLKEARYALDQSRRSATQSPELRPVILEGPPLVPPPEWLTHLHFNDTLRYVIDSAQREAGRQD